MLTPSYHPRAGGVEKHVRLVTRELQRRALNVRIATPHWEAHWPATETVDGVEVSRLSLHTRRGRRQLAPLVTWADVVHTHDAYPFLKYYLPYRFSQPHKPVFVTWHGYEGFPIPPEARVLRRIVRCLTWDSLCAGAFIPKWYRFRCAHITHGGVDAPLEAQPLAARSGAVFVGRLEADTGFMAYLKALRILRERHGIGLPLQVCGDGALRTEGERFAAEVGLEVTFHGRVPDVMPYVQTAQLAFTSGFLGILEAMATGAVVCSVYDNPLKEDYLRLFPGAQHILIASSANSLAEQIRGLMANPAAIADRAAGGILFAQQQTWAKVADLYLDLYAESHPRGARC